MQTKKELSINGCDALLRIVTEVGNLPISSVPMVQNTIGNIALVVNTEWMVLCICLPCQIVQENLIG